MAKKVHTKKSAKPKKEAPPAALSINELGERAKMVYQSLVNYWNKAESPDQLEFV